MTLRFDLSIRAEPLPGHVSPVALFSGPIVLVMSTVRDSEGGLPFEGPLKYPSDWVGTGADSSWLEIGPGDSIGGSKDSRHTRQQLRPFYELKSGEYYRMYFNRAGAKTIEPSLLNFGGTWATSERGRFSSDPQGKFQVEFTGSAVVWEGLRRPDSGIATVRIDGKVVG